MAGTVAQQPDPWAEFRMAPAAPAAAADPWAAFRVQSAAPEPTLGAAMDPGATGVPMDPQSPGPTPNAAKAEFDKLPWYLQAAQAADDIVRLTANGLTLGFADKLAAKGNGTTVADERARSKEADDRAGLAGTLANVAGAVLGPVKLAKGGLTLANATGANAIGGVTGGVARSGLAAAEGAGFGGLGALGNDEDLARGIMQGAVFGGLGNAAVEGATKGLRAGLGAFNRKPTIPTAPEIRQAADAAYAAADNAGVMFTPQGLGRLQQSIINDLAQFGYHPKNQPGAVGALEELNRLASSADPVTLRGLDVLRRIAQGGFKQGEKSNNAVVKKIVDKVDDFIANATVGPTPSHVGTNAVVPAGTQAPAVPDIVAANASDAAGMRAATNALTEARSLWSRLAKADTVNYATDKAARRAATAGAGTNIDNATRQELNAVVNRGGNRGFTADENAALRQAIEGTTDQNALRLVGKLAPTGVVSGGVGAATGYNVGNVVGGPVGAQVGMFAVPAVGLAAKTGADAMGRANVNELLDIILAGGSRAAARGQPNAAQRGVDAISEDLRRAILGVSTRQAYQPQNPQ